MHGANMKILSLCLSLNMKDQDSHPYKTTGKVTVLYMLFCWSQWPPDLRRRSTASRLLRLWVRISWEHGCLSVASVVYSRVDISATS